MSYTIEGEYENEKFKYYISFNGNNGLTIKEEELQLGNSTYKRVIDKLTLPNGKTIDIPSNLSLLSIVRKFGPITFSQTPLDPLTLNFLFQLSKRHCCI